MSRKRKFTAATRYEFLSSSLNHMSAEHGIFGRGSAEHLTRKGRLDGDGDGVLTSIDSEVMTPPAPIAQFEKPGGHRRA